MNCGPPEAKFITHLREAIDTNLSRSKLGASICIHSLSRIDLNLELLFPRKRVANDNLNVIRLL